MIKYLLLSLLFITIQSCRNSESSISQKNCKNEVSFFRTLKPYEFFLLKVEDDFEYLDSTGIISTTPLALFLNNYCSDKDSLKIYVKINDIDSAFVYPLLDADSLILGMSYDKRIIIFNEHEYVWKED